jgi:small-conductance mechanosensitive channel
MTTWQAFNGRNILKGLLISFLALSFINVFSQEHKKLLRHRQDSAFFSGSNILVRSDYLESFEQVFQTLNKVPLLVSTFSDLEGIKNKLDESDSALMLMRSRLSLSRKLQNIRNLQMYNTLLDELDAKSSGYGDALLDYKNQLDDMKKEIGNTRKDSLIREVFRDSVLRASFVPQLKQLHEKWKLADSLIVETTATINGLRAHESSNGIVITELIDMVDDAISDVGSRAFEDEGGYLLGSGFENSNNPFKENFRQSWSNQRKVAHFYFSMTNGKQYWLLLIGVLFFAWVWFNFRSLKYKNKLNAVAGFKFMYLDPLPVSASLVFILSLAPLFDPHAPAIYIESAQFLLMLMLTSVFRKLLERRLFVLWMAFIFLFLALWLTKAMVISETVQRWLELCVQVASAGIGIFFLAGPKQDIAKKRFITSAAGLYIFLNILAAFCNLFGRATLSDICSFTSVYAFAQAVSLGVFVKIITESFLLQVQSSRMRKNYPEQFEWNPIAHSISRYATILAVILWCMVLTTNFQVYDSLNDILSDFFSRQRHVGSFSFTFGGIVLFLGIIWVAHFLQKYIAFFFGDTGDDAAIDDKGQRSRLLITRLILLIAGFLLAVAASGLPVDRITVILGALGVGVGLGLQSIVNNFVSGIILIFDRPLRIGDTVEVGDKKGRVKEISIRSSTLLTEEGAEVIIPNGDLLSHNIVNWTLSNNYVRVGLSFIIDKMPDAEAMQTKIADIVKANPNALTRKEPEILISSITAKSYQVRVLFWCNDISKSDITAAEVRTAIYHYFESEKVNATETKV